MNEFNIDLERILKSQSSTREIRMATDVIAFVPNANAIIQIEHIFQISIPYSGQY